MNNTDFLAVLKDSFTEYLRVNTSRSTAKLKPLHGKIADDLQKILGEDYSIESQGYGNDIEAEIDGRYYPKKADITVKRNGIPVAGYAIKFVLRNYAQNSNNYFENMLGETANIRAKAVPYFQIFIVLDKVPYYEKGGILKKYDYIAGHHIDKYLMLSKDDPGSFLHTPDKTLLVILHAKTEETILQNSEEYAAYYRNLLTKEEILTYSDKIEDTFEQSVILNDYEDFMKRSSSIIIGKQKR